MVIKKLCQSRWFLILLALIPLLLSIIHYYSKSNPLNNISLNEQKLNKKENFITKVFEINDREPTYKLATYEGYQFPLERNRAQTKLIEELKLQEKCQKNPNTTVVDIGASLGVFGFYAAACGCQVYMFEIEPNKISLIEKSIKLNSFESRVHLIKKAVSDLKANKTIYFSKATRSQLTSTKDIDVYDPDVYTGQTINLNQYEFPTSSDIYIFRVDVQGHELHVFRSTEKLFSQNRVHHAIFEYTTWGTQATLQKDIFSYMKHILGAQRFYALHPKQPIMYGPLNDQDINEFHSQHYKQHLQRDVYVLFRGDQIDINAISYQFQLSF